MIGSLAILAASIFNISDLDFSRLREVDYKTGAQETIEQFMSPYLSFLAEGLFYQEGTLEALDLISSHYGIEFKKHLASLKEDFESFHTTKDGQVALNLVNTSILILEKKMQSEKIKEPLFILIDDLETKSSPYINHQEFWRYKGESDTLYRLIEDLENEEIEHYYSENVGRYVDDIGFWAQTKEEVAEKMTLLKTNFLNLRSLIEKSI